MAESIQQAIVDTLKREFIKARWWDEVQEDVKTRLGFLVEHVDKTGPLFMRSFMSLLRWEYKRRQLEGQNVTSPMASYFSTLLGMRISEEAYQCGLMPTRSCLNLYDYIEPNDADVSACFMFCHKVEILEKAGMLEFDESELTTSLSEMAKLLRPRKKKSKPIQEETILWDETDPNTKN